MITHIKKNAKILIIQCSKSIIYPVAIFKTQTLKLMTLSLNKIRGKISTGSKGNLTFQLSICNNRSKTGDDCVTSLEAANNLSSTVSQLITIPQDVSYIETILSHIINAPSTFTENTHDKLSQVGHS